MVATRSSALLIDRTQKEEKSRRYTVYFIYIYYILTAACWGWVVLYIYIIKEKKPWNHHGWREERIKKNRNRHNDEIPSKSGVMVFSNGALLTRRIYYKDIYFIITIQSMETYFTPRLVRILYCTTISYQRVCNAAFAFPIPSACIYVHGHTTALRQYSFSVFNHPLHKIFGFYS